jgi:hypothetical protein
MKKTLFQGLFRLSFIGLSGGSFSLHAARAQCLNAGAIWIGPSSSAGNQWFSATLFKLFSSFIKYTV